MIARLSAKRAIRKSLWLPLSVVLLAAASLAAGCRKANAPAASDAPPDHPSATQTVAAPAPRTAFEKDLQEVRDGNFRTVYVFSRKDGGAINSDDIAYLKSNAPKEVNRWVMTDEKRRVIAGSNFDYTDENLKALRQRFNIEDYTNP